MLSVRASKQSVANDVQNSGAWNLYNGQKVSNFSLCLLNAQAKVFLSPPEFCWNMLDLKL